MSDRNAVGRRRPTIAVLVDGYLPGELLGGPIRSVSAIVETLAGTFDFRIVTRDRDLGATVPYRDVKRDEWQSVGSAQVYYASPESLYCARLKGILSALPYDLLYCNSLFSPRLTLQALALQYTGAIGKSPVIVAPRGELSRGALAIKRRKKAAFLALARAIGLYDGVTWHATTEYERDDIVACFGETQRSSPRIAIAPILSGFGTQLKQPLVRRPKASGSLRVVFFSRVTRKKNLDGALRMLSHLSGQVDFAIYGPREDREYWAQCKRQIARLPANVRVSLNGPLAHSDVAQTLAKYDLFFLPTHGENFGHAILEALAAGCPVLISDQTPWRGLEALEAGWDIPLSDERLMVNALARCVEMDNVTHSSMSSAAARLARRALEDTDAIRQNHAMFMDALAGGMSATE